MSSTLFARAFPDRGQLPDGLRQGERAVELNHSVQFYEADEFLAGAAGTFLEAGARRGDLVVAIATAEHWRRIEERLRAAGLHLEALREAGRFLVLDARECLSRIMKGGRPDPVLFHETVGRGILARTDQEVNRPPEVVCAYGEMVDLLCQEGNIEAAVRVEALWNELAAALPISLLCAYRLDRFPGATDDAALESICALHDHISPAESYLAHREPEGRARQVVFLQQRARALETEVANREQLERALRSALLEKERIEEALRFSEAELRRQNEELSRALRFSEMFVGILGHDLRNPLSGVTTAARLLARRAESEKVARPALRILSSAERMARMIDQLLDFTRIRLGQGIHLERTRVDLIEICRLAIDELDGDTPPGEGGRVRLEMCGDAAGVWDGDRLAQLVSNLIGNALAHGTVGVPARVRIDGTGPMVVLAVENAGAVPPDILPRLFEPLRSGADRKEARSSGLGLGLYISEKIAIAHGGTIEVTSSEVEGTRISVRLPRSPSVVTDAQARPRGP